MVGRLKRAETGRSASGSAGVDMAAAATGSSVRAPPLAVRVNEALAASCHWDERRAGISLASFRRFGAVAAG